MDCRNSSTSRINILIVCKLNDIISYLNFMAICGRHKWGITITLTLDVTISIFTEYFFESSRASAKFIALLIAFPNA